MRNVLKPLEAEAALQSWLARWDDHPVLYLGAQPTFAASAWAGGAMTAAFGAAAATALQQAACIQL